MDLGRFGIWTNYRAIGEENAAEAAQIAEDLGYGTFWLGGSPKLPSVRPLLQGTGTLIVGTSIVNLWDYIDAPEQLAAEHAELTADFPGRLLLGLGVGHPEATQDYAKPLTSMRALLDGLDAAPTPVPHDELALAALRPRMLELSAERTLGALPYFTSVDHTRWARDLLGDGPLIAAELACVIDTDVERGRALSRKYAALYLGLVNYTKNLLNFGFTEADIADGGSDRLIDAVVPHGSVEEIAAVAHAHLEAGADHVCVQPVGVRGIPRHEWAQLSAGLNA